MKRKVKVTRRMWALIDKYENRRNELRDALDGNLFTTRPIPAFAWLKPVRIIVTVTEAK